MAADVASAVLAAVSSIVGAVEVALAVADLLTGAAPKLVLPGAVVMLALGIVQHAIDALPVDLTAIVVTSEGGIDPLPVREGETATRSPMARPETPSPSAAIWPATSWPRIIGSFSRTVPKPPWL